MNEAHAGVGSVSFTTCTMLQAIGNDAAEVQEALARGLVVEGRSPQALQKLVESEVARWTPILKAAAATGN